MGFKKLEAWDMPGNPVEMIEHQAALFTAGTKEHFNTMTIGWGLMGDLWNVPAFTAYVRPSRYTWQFAEENDCFTVSFFGTPRPQALAVLGTKSGRDMDKIHQSGLTPVELEGQVAFEEAQVVLICKKIYVDDLKPEKIPQQWKDKFYGDGDYHRIYTGQVLSVYVKE